jgi:hypothetical protein
MFDFDNFVKSMTPCLLKLKVLLWNKYVGWQFFALHAELFPTFDFSKKRNKIKGQLISE